MTTKGYLAGTHRSVDPRLTLARIRPHLDDFGVTRCADVTGLDTPGIPVYCAIRPAGLTVQVTNGKGVRPVDAQVSALMEAIEVHHAEHPAAGSLRRASLRELRGGGVPVVDPRELPGFRSAAFWSPDYRIDWVLGEDLRLSERTWVPASAVHLSWPAICTFSSNGLASGNDVTEATLHGLYELVERDAISRLRVAGKLAIAERCAVLDLATVSDPIVAGLAEAIFGGGLKLVVLVVPSRTRATTCWAAILDPRPLATSSIVNVGFGAHLSPSVAASRAITEAAQARLTFIHGSRDDLHPRMYSSATVQTRLRGYFDRLRPNSGWQDLPDHSTSTLTGDLDLLMSALADSGHSRVIRVDLTRAPWQIPVVKMLVPGLQEPHF